MSKSPPALRVTYHHDLFVNRATEIKLIVDKVHNLFSEVDRNRVIVFNAPRGAGKSWLLQEIAWQLVNNHDDTVSPYYVDLLPCEGMNHEAAISALLAELLARRGINDDLSGLSVFGRMNLLLHSLQTSTLVDVFLFDHVAEADSALLETLEDRCLAPLTSQLKALIVLAGRGREYTWKSPSLKASSYDLVPFTHHHTQEQLQRQIPTAVAQAKAVQDLSGGYPWANYLYGQVVSPGQPNPPDVIDTLLGEWQVYRPQLQALCILRAFDETRIQALFRECFKDSSWEYATCRKVREQLVATSLVRWEDSKRGYIIDEAIRPILENDLLTRNRSRWRRLHKTAADLYANWAAKYPKSKADWEKEAVYHAIKLKAAGRQSNQRGHSPAKRRK